MINKNLLFQLWQYIRIFSDFYIIQSNKNLLFLEEKFLLLTDKLKFMRYQQLTRNLNKDATQKKILKDMYLMCH